MRQTIINMVAFGVVGGVLSHNGLKANDIAFWWIVICLAVVQVNSMIPSN